MKRIGLIIGTAVLGLVLVGCTSTTAGTGAGTPPASTPPTSSAPVFPPSTTSVPPVTSSPVPPLTSSSVPAGQGDGDWVNQADFTTYPHPGMDCSAADGHGKVGVVRKTIGDINSDGIPDAAVVLECVHSASEWPQTVFVYTFDKKVLGSAIPQSDGLWVSSVRLGAGRLDVDLLGWSASAAGCCPDQAFTQSFTFDGSHLVPGARKQTSGPGSGSTHCGNGALEVKARDQQGAAGHGSVVLTYTNVLSAPCTTKGYPGVDALVGTAHTVASAKRTLRGTAGGADAVKALTVQPGETVSALLEWTTVGSGCTTSDYVDTIPPDDTADTMLTLSVGSCGLQIHPLVAGSSGNG
jgi:hypothetical protein